MREGGGMCPWTPHTREDALLYAYWEQERGRLYTEVPIAGPRGHVAWAAQATTRRLDGVRIPADTGAEGITSFAGHAAEFQRTIRLHRPELIEVKRKLNRTVIGQIIAGHDLFEEQYGVSPARLVFVCAVEDAALKWVCERRNIVVRMI
jgi:hypothetical protein